MAKAKIEGPPLDEKNQKIIDSIIRDPRAAVAAIAKEIEEPESTVQKRLSDLIREGRLERVIRVVDWSATHYPLRYRVEIEVNQHALSVRRGGPVDDDQEIDSQESLADYIKKTLSLKYRGGIIVQDVTILFGRERTDLSATIRAKDHRVLADFITNGVRSLRGVSSTITSLEAWSCVEGEL